MLDEVGFYPPEDQADSDVEVQDAICRGMIGFPHTKLIKISTPYMKSGILYDDFKRGFGQDDPDLLVWRASSQLMNPSIPSKRLQREHRRNPARYAREYDAEFAEDLDAFLPAAWIEAAIEHGRAERSPRVGEQYVAAIDPSGGGPAAFTLAIVHAEGSGSVRGIVQDVMRGWTSPRTATVDLQGVVERIAVARERAAASATTGDTGEEFRGAQDNMRPHPAKRA